jgi:hypothetical protein
MKNNLLIMALLCDDNCYRYFYKKKYGEVNYISSFENKIKKVNYRSIGYHLHGSRYSINYTGIKIDIYKNNRGYHDFIQ